jgi:hypothetical protein
MREKAGAVGDRRNVLLLCSRPRPASEYPMMAPGSHAART